MIFLDSIGSDLKKSYGSKDFKEKFTKKFNMPLIDRINCYFSFHKATMVACLKDIEI